MNENSTSTQQDLKLEVVVVPVSDVDASKRFYTDLGFRLDADFSVDGGLRVVQVTPPGSPTSVIFGDKVSSATPGSVQGLHLVTRDIELARKELEASGADVSEVWHDADGIFHQAGTDNRVDGLHPERADYGSFVSFADPDGNGWIVQEVVNRLPGREDGTLVDLEEAAAHVDVGAVVEGLLRGAADAHGVYERDLLDGLYDEDWPAWYAAHIVSALRDSGYRLMPANVV